MGTSKNLASLVFSVPNFSFWLKEGVLSTSYMLFFATPSFRLPSHWVFRGALKIKIKIRLQQKTHPELFVKKVYNQSFNTQSSLA
jgi:hypothetical protein